MTHSKGGRPSRGDRTLTVAGIPTSLADLIRTNAQSSDLTALTYMWTVLAEELDEPWFAPPEVHDSSTGVLIPLRQILLESQTIPHIDYQWTIEVRDEDPLVRMSLNIPTPLSVAMRAAAKRRSQTTGQFLTGILCDWHGIPVQSHWSWAPFGHSARKERMTTQ